MPSCCGKDDNKETFFNDFQMISEDWALLALAVIGFYLYQNPGTVPQITNPQLPLVIGVLSAGLLLGRVAGMRWALDLTLSQRYQTGRVKR